MKKLILIPILVCLLAISASANEYVAKIVGTSDWAPFTKVQLPSKNFVAFSSKIYPETLVMVYAVADGHLPFEEGTVFYSFISSANAKLDKDEKIPFLMVDGTCYLNVTYRRYLARVNKQEGNIKIWQFLNGNVEYSIMSVCPNAENVAVESFISNNLKLLPPPTVSEEDFLSMVRDVQNLCSQNNGIPLDDGLKIIKIEASPANKELVRTYKIDDSYPQDMRELLLSREGNEAMVEGEKDTALLVQQAVALGYSLVNVWQNQKGERLVSYKIFF